MGCLRRGAAALLAGGRPSCVGAADTGPMFLPRSSIMLPRMYHNIMVNSGQGEIIEPRGPHPKIKGFNTEGAEKSGRARRFCDQDNGNCYRIYDKTAQKGEADGSLAWISRLWLRRIERVGLLGLWEPGSAGSPGANRYGPLLRRWLALLPEIACARRLAGRFRTRVE
jgi:hypothetical protein